MSATYRYTQRVSVDVAVGEVPAQVPVPLREWVRPATLDGSAWWQWGGVGEGDPVLAWQAWQQWRGTWATSFVGPSVALLSWAGQVCSAWHGVLGTAVDPAACATLILGIDEILETAAQFEVVTWSSQDSLLGYAVPGVLHVLTQGEREDLLLTQTGLWVESHDHPQVRTPVDTWSLTHSGRVRVNGRELGQNTSAELLKLGRQRGQVRCRVMSLAQACRPEWETIQKGLLYAMDNYKYARVHTLA